MIPLKIKNMIYIITVYFSMIRLNILLKTGTEPKKKKKKKNQKNKPKSLSSI